MSKPLNYEGNANQQKRLLDKINKFRDATFGQPPRGSQVIPRAALPFDPSKPRPPNPAIDDPGSPPRPQDPFAGVFPREPRPSPRPQEVPFQVMPRPPNAQIAAPPPVTGGMGTQPMGGMGTQPMGGMGTPPIGAPNPAMMKKGGAVKAKAFAKGGSVSKVSSASSRADGCATKGKTKGRFV